MQLPWSTARWMSTSFLSLAMETIKDFLFNVTISWSNYESNRNQTTNVTTIIWENVYRFQHPAKLYDPYGTTLFITIFSLIFNLWTLRKKKVSANQGFLQVLCTTAAVGNTVREIAMMSSEGGSETMIKDLKDIEVIFGLLEGGDRNGKQMMGFGTPDESSDLAVRARSFEMEWRLCSGGESLEREDGWRRNNSVDDKLMKEGRSVFDQQISSIHRSPATHKSSLLQFHP